MVSIERYYEALTAVWFTDHDEVPASKSCARNCQGDFIDGPFIDDLPIKNGNFTWLC